MLLSNVQYFCCCLHACLSSMSSTKLCIPLGRSAFGYGFMYGYSTDAYTRIEWNRKAGATSRKKKRAGENEMKKKNKTNAIPFNWKYSYANDRSIAIALCIFRRTATICDVFVAQRSGILFLFFFLYLVHHIHAWH